MNTISESKVILSHDEAQRILDDWVNQLPDRNTASSIRIQRLFDSFLNTSHNKSCFFSNDRITHLPNIFNYPSFSEKITDIYLCHHDLMSIPESFGSLINLQLVHLSSNKLESIPESFGYLRNLKYLSMEHNNLEKLPESFSCLTNLVRCDLSHNNFSEITVNFENFTQLNTLNFSHNRQPLSFSDSILNISNNFSVFLSGSCGLTDAFQAKWLEATTANEGRDYKGPLFK